MKKERKSQIKVCMVVLNNFTNDSRVLREAMSLEEEGYQVFVIAIYEDGLKRKENIDGVQVFRTFLRTKNWPKNKIFQIFKYIEFTIKSFIFIKKQKPHICHCHDLNTLPLGYIAKIFLKSYLIYDSHELESQRSTLKKEPGWFRWLDRKLEHFLVKRVDEIIVVCDSIADYIAKQDKVRRPFIVRNIPDLKKDILVPKKEDHLDFSNEYKIIIYQGGLFLNRGIEELIEAIKLLDKKIILVILGEGLLYDKLIAKIKKLDLNSRVILKGYVPPSEILKLTSQADLGIVPVKKITLSYYFALPNKFFEYITAGLPIAASNFPEMEKIIKQYKIGEVFDPENPKDIARAIEKIFSDKNYYRALKNNIRRAQNDLNWTKEKKKIIKIYKNIKN